MSIAPKLRDMHALGADSCDPEFRDALLEAAIEIERLQTELDRVRNEKYVYARDEIDQLQAGLTTAEFDRLSNEAEIVRLTDENRKMNKTLAADAIEIMDRAHEDHAVANRRARHADVA